MIIAIKLLAIWLLIAFAVALFIGPILKERRRMTTIPSNPRTPRVSAAPTASVHRFQDTRLASVPRRSPLPPPSPAAGASPTDWLAVVIGLAVFGGIAYFFMVLS